jgi:hypothetical protein
MKYRPAEIWLADWVIKTKKRTFYFKNMITKRIPMQFLMNEKKFDQKVRNLLTPTEIRKGYEHTVKVTYIKYISKVNDGNPSKIPNN